mgnify:CR=1 FL=1
MPGDLRRSRRRGQPGAAAVGAVSEGRDLLGVGADVGLLGLGRLVDERLPDLGQQSHVGRVHPEERALDRLLVPEPVPLRLRVVLQRLVGIELVRLAVELPRPGPHGEVRREDRSVVEGLRLVHDERLVDRSGFPAAFTRRAHATGDLEALRLGLAALLVHDDRALAAHGGHVERERLRGAHVGIGESREEDAQQGAHVGDGADRRAGVGRHALLGDDDRRGDALEGVDLRARQCGHEGLDEGGVRLVDEALALSRDRVEHQARLPGSGDSGEYGHPPLRDVDVDALEVVDVGPADRDDLVVVGGLALWRHGGHPPISAVYCDGTLHARDAFGRAGR